MPTTLIAENVLLLMLDDDSGAFVAADRLRPALAGALLAELALTGAVEVETSKGLWKRAQVVVDDATAVTDPVLIGALQDIGEKPRSPQDLVNRLGKALPDQLCRRLADRGILRREQSKVFGVFPRTRWPAADSQHEAGLRSTLQRVLAEGEDPDERIATVIAVLAAADVLHKVLDRGALSKKDLKKRAEQIADGGWATEAVRKAIQAAQTAVAAAVTASTAVAASSGS